MSEKMRFCNLVDFVIIFIKPFDKDKSTNLLLLGFILTLRRSILLFQNFDQIENLTSKNNNQKILELTEGY